MLAPALVPPPEAFMTPTTAPVAGLVDYSLPARTPDGALPDSEKTPHHFLVCGAMPVFLAALLNAENEVLELIATAAPIERPIAAPGVRTW